VGFILFYEYSLHGTLGDQGLSGNLHYTAFDTQETSDPQLGLVLVL